MRKLGYVPLSQTGAELLFNALAERAQAKRALCAKVGDVKIGMTPS
jgi:hypothetical protein